MQSLGIGDCEHGDLGQVFGHGGRRPAGIEASILIPHSEISDNGIAPADDHAFPGGIRAQTGACFDYHVDFVSSETILIQNLCFNFKNSSYLNGFARPGIVKLDLVFILFPREAVIVRRTFSTVAMRNIP